MASDSQQNSKNFLLSKIPGWHLEKRFVLILKKGESDLLSFFVVLGISCQMPIRIIFLLGASNSSGSSSLLCILANLFWFKTHISPRVRVCLRVCVCAMVLWIFNMQQFKLIFPHLPSVYFVSLWGICSRSKINVPVTLKPLKVRSMAKYSKKLISSKKKKKC